MNNPNIISQNRIIDCSSDDSMSDHETKLHITDLNGSFSDEEKQHDPKKEISNLLQITPESQENRLYRLSIHKADVIDLSNKIQTGIIVLVNNNMVLAQHSGEILNIGNILYIKQNNTFDVLGEIEDVLGSIESPLYYIKTDWYILNVLKQNLVPRTPIYVKTSDAKYITSNDIEKMISEKGTDSVFGDGNDASQDSFDQFSGDEDHEEEGLKKRTAMEFEEEGELNYEKNQLERVVEIDGCSYRIPSILNKNKKVKYSNSGNRKYHGDKRFEK